jgi:hypothetical protein
MTTHRKVTEELVAEWKQLHADGMSYAKLERKYKFQFASSTIKRYIHGQKIRPPMTADERVRSLMSSMDDNEHIVAPKCVKQDGIVLSTYRFLWQHMRGDEPLPEYMHRTCAMPDCVNPYHYEEFTPGKVRVPSAEKQYIYDLWLSGLGVNLIAERTGRAFRTVHKLTIGRFLRENDVSQVESFHPNVRKSVLRYIKRTTTKRIYIDD